jgi:hypothetical protein
MKKGEKKAQKPIGVLAKEVISSHATIRAIKY